MTEKLEPCPVCLSKEDPDYWQKHLDLARRAEIGRTLEQILTVNPGSLRVFAFEQWLTDENALDALRALASKLNITDETGGTTR